MKKYPENKHKRIHWWLPPIPEFRPTKNRMNSSLCIAAIVSNRLYQGLRYEGELFLLTPENGEHVLYHGKPDLLIVESCLQSVSGHWYSSLTVKNENQACLVRILSVANKLQIPTLFWFTEDHLYHSYYNEIIHYFDYVFCSDPREAEILQPADNIYCLLPAIQPGIHNPFKNYIHANSYDTGVLYDGLVDLFRSDALYEMLLKIRKFDLWLMDSSCLIYTTKSDQLSDFKSHFLGCVNESGRMMALKYARMAFASEQSQITRTRQQWMMLETVACRLAMVYWGRLAKGDIRHDILIQEPDADEILFILAQLEKEPLYREKTAHGNWRSVHCRHTFSHRIREICRIIGIEHDWEEFPLVTVIIPTFRIPLIKRCIEQFDRQTYPNKELVLVLNTNEFNKKNIREIIGERDDIRIYIAPSERVAGGCLNFGINAARGLFCVKMDDDDIYSNHFVYDMVLNQRSVDADIFGKANRFIHFEDDNTTYSRKIRPPSTIIPHEKLLEAHISGNSLSGKTRFLKNNKYSDLNFGSTDSVYHLNCDKPHATYALFDDFGLIMERRVDTSTHNWQASSHELKSRMHYTCDGKPEEVLC